MSHEIYRHVHNGQTYVAHVTWDREARLFHGKVANLRDVITFQSKEEEGLESAFEESILDYLTFCAKLGREPETPCSGRFLIRTTPKVHQSIMEAAATRGLNVNTWVEEILTQAASIVS